MLAPLCNVQNAPRGYYITPDYVKGDDGTYVMRYSRIPLNWRGKTPMTFSSKLIGQPTLCASEGTIYETKLDVSNQKVKGLKKSTDSINQVE